MTCYPGITTQVVYIRFGPQENQSCVFNLKESHRITSEMKALPLDTQPESSSGVYLLSSCKNYHTCPVALEASKQLFISMAMVSNNIKVPMVSKPIFDMNWYPDHRSRYALWVGHTHILSKSTRWVHTQGWTHTQGWVHTQGWAHTQGWTHTQGWAHIQGCRYTRTHDASIGRLITDVTNKVKVHHCQ